MESSALITNLSCFLSLSLFLCHSYPSPNPNPKIMPLPEDRGGRYDGENIPVAGGEGSRFMSTENAMWHMLLLLPWELTKRNETKRSPNKYYCYLFILIKITGSWIYLFSIIFIFIGSQENVVDSGKWRGDIGSEVGSNINFIIFSFDIAVTHPPFLDVMSYFCMLFSFSHHPFFI